MEPLDLKRLTSGKCKTLLVVIINRISIVLIQSKTKIHSGEHVVKEDICKETLEG